MTGIGKILNWTEKNSVSYHFFPIISNFNTDACMFIKFTSLRCSRHDGVFIKALTQHPFTFNSFYIASQTTYKGIFSSTVT